MNTLIESIESLQQAVVLVSWKGTLLALAAGLVLLPLYRHISPAWRHGVWLLVVLRFIIPDLGIFAISLDGIFKVPAVLMAAPAASEDDVPRVEEPAEELQEAGPVGIPLEMARAAPPAAKHEAPAVMAAPAAPAWTMKQKLAFAWICGAGAAVCIMVVLHLRLLRRIRKDASEPFSEISAALDEACRLAGVRRKPGLMVTDAISAPSLFGVVNPVILLPRQVAAGKDAAALKLILLHELAHLQRRDLWVQILSSCVIALHWFNPMVWIAARRLRAEAEMAADAHALKCTDAAEAHRFGTMLLGFAQHAAAGWVAILASATVLGISANPKELRRRIEGLMDIAKGRRTRWVIGMGAFMMLAVIGLTRAPAEDLRKAEAKDADKAAEPTATTTVSGIVVDENDKPVADAEVKLSINLISRSEQPSQMSGEDGKFKFEGVPKAASLNLRAMHGDYAESKMLVFQGVSGNVERRLVLPKVVWVTGKVTDKRDGTPIKGAQVLYGVENKFPIISRYDWKQPFVRTNDAGEYRLPLKLRDLNEVIVRAWAAGMTSQSKVFKTGSGETTMDMVLEPVERIPGKVVDAEDKPVKDALVWVVEDAVRLDEASGPIMLETIKTDRSKLTAGKFFISVSQSDAGGNFGLPDADPLLKDKLWVVALHPDQGLARMKASEMKRGMIFKLEPWASMSGRLHRDDGTPVVETEVMLHAKCGPEFRPDAESFKISHQIKFTTDKNGGYKIERLTPGASFSGMTLKREYCSFAPVTVSAGPQPSREIVLGSSLRRKQSGGVRAVMGRIVLPEGHAYTSKEYFINLSINSQGGTIPGLPRPDADGKFITESLPPGNYELSVRVHPMKTGMDLPRDAGRWMRFKVEAGDAATPLNLGDIILEKSDLTFKPRAENSTAPQPPPVYVEGPEGRIEITTQDTEKKPVAGVKVEILDLIDHARAPMNLGEVIGKYAPKISDENGKVTLSFPRAPVEGRKAYGVMVIGTAQDGSKSRKTEMMDGRTSELRMYPETVVDIAIASPIVEWSASSSIGLVAEKQPLKGGELKARLALEHSSYVMLQGTTADGRVLFSNALGPVKNGVLEIKQALTLMPGAEIEGKIEGLPADEEGTGGVVAKIFVKGHGEPSQIMKGYPPSVSWMAWAPVGRDGRFHFKAVPAGMVSLTGLGKGWITHGLLDFDSSTLVNTATPTGKVSVSLNTKPCSKRSVRVLLPDGKPAAGATVKVELPALGMLSYNRTKLQAEDAEKRERFDKEPWAARQMVADDQGIVILENRPPGKVYCQVYWTDAETQHPHWGSANVTFSDQDAKTPLEMQVSEK